VTGPEFLPYPLPAPPPPAPPRAAPAPPAAAPVPGGVSRAGVAAGVAAVVAVVALVVYLGAGGSPVEPDPQATQVPTTAPPPTVAPPVVPPVVPPPTLAPPAGPSGAPGSPSPSGRGPAAATDPTAPGELVGTVTNAIGAPIAGAGVVVTRAIPGDGSQVATCPTPVTTRTAASGRYAVALCQLGPGLGYHVTVRSGGRTAAADLFVEQGRTTTFAVVLDVRVTRG